jgi:hypothetical protein
MSDLESQSLLIETDWLRSVEANFTSLPKHVAEAVALRITLQSLPLDQAHLLSERIVANGFLKPDKDIPPDQE